MARGIRVNAPRVRTAPPFLICSQIRVDDPTGPAYPFKDSVIVSDSCYKGVILMASTPIHMGMIDHSAEATSVNFHLPAVAGDGSNWAALFAPVTGKYDILKASLITLTKLNLTRSTMSQVVDSSVGSIPAAQDAQREWAARIIYVDNVTTKKYRFDVPGPADTIIPSGTDELDFVGNAVLAAFKVDFEANAVSPDGNAVTIQRGYITGRRN